MGLEITDLIVHESAAFSVSPTAPTPTVGDSTTKLATTEFVTTALNGVSTGIIMTSDITLTVGPTGNYTDLQTCVDYCKTLNPVKLYKITIVLLNSFTFTNTIFFRDFDFSHITITTENYLTKLTADDCHALEYTGGTVNILDSEFVHVSETKAPSTPEQWADPYVRDVIVLEDCNPPIFNKLYLTYTGLVDFCGGSTDFNVFKISNIKGTLDIQSLVLGYKFSSMIFDGIDLQMSVYFYNIQSYNGIRFHNLVPKPDYNLWIYFGKSSNTLGFLEFKNCLGVYVVSSNNWLDLYNSNINSTIQITTPLTNFNGHTLFSSKLSLYYQKGVSGSITFSNYYVTVLENASILLTRFDLVYVKYRDPMQSLFTLTLNTWTSGGVYYTNLLSI